MRGALLLPALALQGAAGLVIRGGEKESGPSDGYDEAACAAPPNSVVRENCAEGNPPEEWDIPGAGDPSIQGFATQQSYAPGETVVFKVKSEASEYRIDIYRVGYYRGMGARRVARFAPSASLPQRQPPCVTDEATLLVDCGSWRESARWPVPDGAASGVYFARLVRTDRPPRPPWRADASRVAPNPKFANPEWDDGLPPPCGWGFDCPDMDHAYGAQRLAAGRKVLVNALHEPRASHVYFVVRDDSRAADILFQTSDTTWHAYNTYGAPNTYGGVPLKHHNFSLAGRWDGRVRSYKRSYNVPMLTRDQRTVNMLWQCEYPMIRWLERNGYDVVYWSSVDTDVRGAQLSRHRLFLSVGHDEYWSTQQRRHVEAARDAGVHLAFLSGNEVYWNVRWEASADGSGTPHRTMVVYKESQQSSKLDPKEDAWTGTFRDAKPHNPQGAWPENSLTGTIFTVNAWRNDALEVPSEYAALRFWRHTPIADLREGERAVLLKGLLGHEWDEDVDNGHRPPGLIRMSETTVNNVQYLIDSGATFDSGTGTHHLVMYRSKSGSLVFGAGTVQWMWGLDDHHDAPTGLQNQLENEYLTRVGVEQMGTEPAVVQATVNVFVDMGVRPALPQPGIVVDAAPGSDKEAPRCKITAATPLRLGKRAAVRVTGTAADTGGGVVAAVEVSVDGGRRWHPASIAGRRAGEVEWIWERVWAHARDASPTAAVVTARAADDSCNLGPSAEPVTVALTEQSDGDDTAGARGYASMAEARAALEERQRRRETADAQDRQRRRNDAQLHRERLAAERRAAEDEDE
eukprot:TRINITY_DN20400_c0_g1_i1.p1 TRINITY_DN20400_c0_g1~~TRINITY_DN20400_c0_g1_i1.p1  ORF type:complete len:830 (+),score=230.91 TRINITY_DN20400_c0_g1_i1:87-2492(+)